MAWSYETRFLEKERVFLFFFFGGFTPIVSNFKARHRFDIH